MTHFGMVLRVLFLLFVICLIFEIIRKILGGSLGLQELVAALLIANLGYTYRINSKLSEHIGWHRGRENHIK